MRLIAIIVIAGTLLAGGLYWYFEIHRSGVYARAVVPIWEEFEALGIKPEFSDASLKDERNYQGALEILRKRGAVVEDIRERLSRLQPSSAYTQMHEDFVAFLDGYSAAILDAEKKAKFFVNAQDLQHLLKEQPSGVTPLGKTDSSSGSINTMNDITKLLEDRIPQLKGVGGEIFKEGLSRLIPGVPFEKLFSSWQDAAPMLDTVLQLVRGFNPNLPASQLLPLLKSSNKQTELDRINKYLEEAETASRAITARDILAYRAFEGEGGITKERLELRASRLREAMEELKKKYIYKNHEPPYQNKYSAERLLCHDNV